MTEGTHMDIPATLTHLRPGEQWSLNGDSYDGLTWLDETPAPTEAELLAAWPEVEVARANEAAAAARAVAYKAEADPLFFYWQAGEGSEEAWLEKRAEIRDRYPYVGV
jgi:hypothetical protein